MKSKMQRRGVTSKKKALSGIGQKLRDGSEERNRDNDFSKYDRYNDNTSESGGYSNVEKSARARMEREEDNPFFRQNEGRVERPRRRDRFNEYASAKNQLSPWQLKYGDDGNDDRRNEEESNSDDNAYYGEQRRQLDYAHYPSEYKSSYSAERGNYNSPYGEHPASRGAEEYRGSNKRRSGLGNYNSGYSNENGYQEPRTGENYYSDGREDEREYPDEENENTMERDYRNYMNRGLYRKAYHSRVAYDPAEENYTRAALEDDLYGDRFYHHEGAQSSGNIDGFGISAGIQHGRDWIDEDEHRRGHAPRKQARGKFGAR